MLVALIDGVVKSYEPYFLVLKTLKYFTLSTTLPPNVCDPFLEIKLSA
jgi:hypothetical protein